MTFTRDRFTWLTYFLLGFYAFYQASLSPIMPFLKDELGLNYTMSGFFFSAFALGMIAAGLGADRVRARVGRRAMLWGGAAGMAAGVLLLVLSPTAVLSITAVFLMGAIGTLIIVAVQATLSDKYGSQRGVALAEANISAIAAAASVPLLVGAGQALGLGWRSGLLLPLPALLVFYLVDRGAPVPEKQEGAGRAGSEGPLPALYWLYWLAIFLGIAAEWCVVLWTPAYLETVSGFSKTAAAASASVLLGAMVLGRIIGSRLTRRYALETLLPLALLLTLGGFLLFWRATAVPLTLIGLFITGLALSNIFTYVLALATTAGAAQIDRASSRLSLAGGLAIFLAPLTLGAIADRLGMQPAFVVVVALLLATLGIALVARRVGRAEQRIQVT
jgi:fucose permease